MIFFAVKKMFSCINERNLYDIIYNDPLKVKRIEILLPKFLNSVQL